MHITNHYSSPVLGVFTRRICCVYNHTNIDCLNLFIFKNGIVRDIVIRLSWVVFVHAFLLAIESIAIEILTERLQISALAVSAISIPIAGSTLLSINVMLDRITRKRSTSTTASMARKSDAGVIVVFRNTKFLFPGSALLAAGVFMWYDSVSRVGASKEGLLAGPFETIVIVILAGLFLKERLGKAQYTGIMIALSGMVLTILSGHSGGEGTTVGIVPHLLLLFTAGDIEAILSAASFAAGVIFLSKMTESYKVMHVTSASLLVSGLLLLFVFVLSGSSVTLSQMALIALAVFSLIPLAAALSYIAGLAKIGASLTSTIASSSILLTIVFQLAMLQAGIEMTLPGNIPLAVAGGASGVLGIYLVHKPERHVPST
jgi:drug/metabolite transporter (DMT)-like permease